MTFTLSSETDKVEWKSVFIAMVTYSLVQSVDEKTFIKVIWPKLRLRIRLVLTCEVFKQVSLFTRFTTVAPVRWTWRELCVGEKPCRAPEFAVFVWRVDASMVAPSFVDEWELAGKARASSVDIVVQSKALMRCICSAHYQTDFWSTPKRLRDNLICHAIQVLVNSTRESLAPDWLMDENNNKKPA